MLALPQPLRAGNKRSQRRHPYSPRTTTLVTTSLLLIPLPFLSHPASAATLTPTQWTIDPQDDHTQAGKDFTADFAAAIGVAAVVVLIGTTLICVFAHCWRQILDQGCCGCDGSGWTIRKRSNVGSWNTKGKRKRRTSISITATKKNKREKNKKPRTRGFREEAWFCGPDRGLPMPQFEMLQAESDSGSDDIQNDIDTDPFRSRPLAGGGGYGPVNSYTSSSSYTPHFYYRTGQARRADRSNDDNYINYGNYSNSNSNNNGEYTALHDVAVPNTPAWTATATACPRGRDRDSWGRRNTMGWMDSSRGEGRGEDMEVGIERPASVAYLLDRP